MKEYDLFVIGAGSGGVRAARIASENGAHVAIAEEYRVGGTCVIRGCIPKKLMVIASQFSKDFEDAKSYGWKVGKPEFDWKTLVAAKDKEIQRLSDLYLKTLKNHKVDLYQERARLIDKNTILLGDKKVRAKYILIAGGSHPFVPDTQGAELAITSNEIFHLDRLPKSILIAGAGYIAVEFACILNALGVRTKIIYRRSKVLRGFDEDVRDHLTTAMNAAGISFIFNAVIEKIEKTGKGLKAFCSNGEVGEFDQVMLAIGRNPNTGDLGLEEAGVDLDKNGAVIVDKYSKSSVENIYAVGDVTNRINLTPVAIKEGHAFALSVFGGEKISPEHENVPAAVFSQPQVATVGLSEDEAFDKCAGEIDIYQTSFRVLKHTLTPRKDKTYIKMIVDHNTQVVIGLHMLGPDAAEIMQGMAIAVKNRLTKKQFDSTVAIHPTTAEEFVLMKK